VDLARVVTWVAAAVTLPAAALFASLGAYTQAVAAGLAAAAALLLAWNRDSPVGYTWIVFALLAGSFAAYGHPIVAAAVAVGLVLVVGLYVAPDVREIRLLRAAELEPAEPAATMAGAEAAVAAFEAVGFRRIGGHRAQLGPHVIVVTVLIGEAGDRFAAVTERIVEVVSRFGDRTLVTTNRAQLPLPAGVLRQEIADSGPDELVSAHDVALRLLAAQEARPDRLGTDAEVLELALSLDLQAVRFVADASWKYVLRKHFRRTEDEPMLAGDDAGRRRIDAWLAPLAAAGEPA
jgi:hypothetical protein